MVCVKESIKVKFKDVPVGGRIKEYGKVWVVLKNYGDGLIVEYDRKTCVENYMMSLCSFVDENSGITLESEVNFIG